MVEFESVSAEDLFARYLGKDLTPAPGQNVSVAINMIATVDGVTTIPQTSGVANEQGIGHPVDQRLMRVLRVHADCVLNGANTLEASGSESSLEGYPDLIEERRKRGKAEIPFTAVLTTKAEFDDTVLSRPFFTDPRFPSILFVGRDAPAENLERVRHAAEPKGDNFHIELLSKDKPTIEEVLERLHNTYGVAVLLVEGGSGVNGSFVASRRVDHLFFTEAPYLAIASPRAKTTITGPRILTRDELVNLALVSAYFVRETGMTFKHYRVV